MLSVPVSDQDQSRGNPDAPVTLVEYGDFQCPTCGAAYPIVKQLEAQFGDQLRFVYRNFPLPMHQYAEHAAEASLFAASHGKFWPMYDLLFHHQRDLRDATLLRLAKDAALPSEGLAQALDDGTYADAVQRDIDSGEASGVQGTPTFFINGRMHRGPFDFDTLADAIQAEL